MFASVGLSRDRHELASARREVEALQPSFYVDIYRQRERERERKQTRKKNRSR